MSALTPVELVAHNSQWAAIAAAEIDRLSESLGPDLRAVYHIGSTSIAGIAAKPIVDLLGLVSLIEKFDDQRPEVEKLGYEWKGEYGLPGRRFCTLANASGHKTFHLHVYSQSSPEIERHLAFRDYLRERPDLAALYEQLKRRCRDAHPNDSDAYTDCKTEWIRAVEAEAIAWRRRVWRSCHK
jgi:GrpB-like predicted nucleotidyltransferase (UPF0157 family)